jgi:hypothetical protein
VAAILVVAACGGAAQNPPGGETPSELACLVTLASECCTSGQASCIGNFAAAEQCSSWAKTAQVTVFATPCAGMTAVRTILSGNSYASFYVYDASGALYAIGDDATSLEPTSDTVECGAGPSGFVVSSACATVWRGSVEGTSCTAGTTPATSVCH